MDTEHLTTYRPDNVTPRIDHMFKARWTKALRSGDYRQARGTMRAIDEAEGASYCCLGVAHCLAPDPEHQFEDSNGVLSSEVAGLYGFETNAPKIHELVNPSGLTVSLPDLNDNARLTFPQLADLIDYFL